MWDPVGIAGFIIDDLWNLDGKVNPDATRAIASNALPQYIAKSNFEWLVDVDSSMVAQVEKQGVYYRLVDSVEGFSIYRLRDKSSGAQPSQTQTIAPSREQKRPTPM